MPPNEHSIRVTARGEFGELQNNLKNLKRNLTDVTGVIDKGARKGGLFDQSQMRSLDIFNKRYADSMKSVNKELERQNGIVEKLMEKRGKADKVSAFGINDEIKQREKSMKTLRQQLSGMEALHSQRTKEAREFKMEEGKGGSGGSGGASRLGSFLKGPAGFLMGIAGLAGLGSVVSEAMEVAKHRQIGSLDLAQRMRGYGGRGGSATSMYDEASEVGRRDNMGYTQPETWGFLDQLTSQAGGVSTSEQYRMQRFARGHGVDLGALAGLAGSAHQVGAGGVADFTDTMAGSVANSGMTPRIVEVMQTAVSLLSTISTTLKDGGDKNILAVQSMMDKIGNENGMQKLTGAQGAKMISGLGSVFNGPENSPWRWMGMTALQQFGDEGKDQKSKDYKDYKHMDWYDLNMASEDGISNPDMLGSMGKYIKTMTKDPKGQATMMRSMMDAGGIHPTQRQAQEFWEVTHGLQDLGSDKAKSLMTDMQKGNDPYKDRIDEYGQTMLAQEAAWLKALEPIGALLLTTANEIKSIFTKLLDAINPQIMAIAERLMKYVFPALNKILDKIIGLLGGESTLSKIGKLIFPHPEDMHGNAPAQPNSWKTDLRNLQGGRSNLSFFAGWRDNMTQAYGDDHPAIDIAGDTGTSLGAVTRGYLELQPGNKEGGNEAIIHETDEDNNLTGRHVLYSHLNNYDPNVWKRWDNGSGGDIPIEMGDNVGYLGSTGHSTEPHLHFGEVIGKPGENWKKGNWVDPTGMLDAVGGLGGTGSSSLGPSIGDGGAVTINANINLSGDGVASLNSKTLIELRQLIKEVIEQIGQQNLQLNPTSLKM